MLKNTFLVIPIVLIAFRYSSAIICYQCDKELDVNRCTTPVECRSNEVCNAHWTTDAQGITRYTFGCIPKTICDMYIFGKRDLSAGCCGTNYCNWNLIKTGLTTTSSTTTTTTTPTITTRPQTTASTATAQSKMNNNSTAVSCHLCRGPKFICERSHRSEFCGDPELQYCINDIENLIDGSRYVTRRCATQQDCNRDWIAGSSDRNECKHYNVHDLVDAHFTCSFCCKGDNCNIETVPKNLYSSMSCHLCRGPKSICERSYTSEHCANPDQQYCINDLEILIDGSRYVTRRCATKEDCNRDWVADAATRSECQHYVNSSHPLQHLHFKCSFCCQGENCNGDIVPHNLYQYVSCNFDIGFCGWTQLKSDQFDWSIWSGSTPSAGTGPLQDHTSGRGYYIYTETSTRTQNQTARLQSPIVIPTWNSATYCLSFWYHMYGSSIGGLNVYIQTGSSMGSPVWTRKGDQGNKWNNAKITITRRTQYHIIMEGVTGNGPRVDVAVDDISVTNEACRGLFVIL